MFNTMLTQLVRGMPGGQPTAPAVNFQQNLSQLLGANWAARGPLTPGSLAAPQRQFNLGGQNYTLGAESTGAPLASVGDDINPNAADVTTRAQQYTLATPTDGGTMAHTYDANGNYVNSYQRSSGNGLGDFIIPAIAIAAMAYGGAALMGGAEAAGGAAGGAAAGGASTAAAGAAAEGSLAAGASGGAIGTGTADLGLGAITDAGIAGSPFTAGAGAASAPLPAGAGGWMAATGGPAVGSLGAPTFPAETLYPGQAGGSYQGTVSTSNTPLGSLMQGYQVASLLAGLLNRPQAPGGSGTPGMPGQGGGTDLQAGAGAGRSASGMAVGGVSGTQQGVANTLLTTKDDQQQGGGRGTLLGG